MRKADPGEGSPSVNLSTSPHNLAPVTEATQASSSDSPITALSAENAPVYNTDSVCSGTDGCDGSNSDSNLKSDQSETPEKSPKPELPPRTFSSKVDNSVDPVTGRKVSQSFYLEMTGSKLTEPKRPVSEVRPQISEKYVNVDNSDTEKVDNYGILFPNLKKDILAAPKRCEMARSNTVPDDGGYIGMDPASPTEKFKEKQGLLRRTNTAPEESAYIPMTNPKTANDQKEDTNKENEYSEIPEKQRDLPSPSSPNENIYATIPETKKDTNSGTCSEAGDVPETKEISADSNKGLCFHTALFLVAYCKL